MQKHHRSHYHTFFFCTNRVSHDINVHFIFDNLEEGKNAIAAAGRGETPQLGNITDMMEAEGVVTRDRGLGEAALGNAMRALDTGEKIQTVPQETRNAIARSAADKLLQGLMKLADSDLDDTHKATQITAVEEMLGVSIDPDSLRDNKEYEGIIEDIDQEHLNGLYEGSKKAAAGSGMEGTSEISRTLNRMLNPDLA